MDAFRQAIRFLPRQFPKHEVGSAGKNLVLAYRQQLACLLTLVPYCLYPQETGGCLMCNWRLGRVRVTALVSGTCRVSRWSTFLVSNDGRTRTPRDPSSATPTSFFFFFLFFCLFLFFSPFFFLFFPLQLSSFLFLLFYILYNVFIQVLFT